MRFGLRGVGGLPPLFLRESHSCPGGGGAGDLWPTPSLPAPPHFEWVSAFGISVAFGFDF